MKIFLFTGPGPFSITVLSESLMEARQHAQELLTTLGRSDLKVSGCKTLAMNTAVPGILTHTIERSSQCDDSSS